MKRIIFVSMFCVGSFSVFAQNEDKTVQDTTTTTTLQVVQEKSPEEKLAEAENTIEEPKKYLLELRDIETKLGFAQRENDELKKNLKLKKNVQKVWRKV